MSSSDTTEKNGMVPGELENLSQNGREKQSPGSTKKQSNARNYMRIFTYASNIEYLIGSVGILAAIGSGVALAMVNLVLGDFINVMTDFASTGSAPAGFMKSVSKYSLYFVYIGIARFACTYIYSTLLTYVALRITRNIRCKYFKSALAQEVSFFDQGAAGSISMQATSNGKLIQSGISEKLGQIFQALSTFVAAFIIAFVSQWKLTLILMSMVPALLLVVMAIAPSEASLEVKMLKTYGQAGSFAEAVLGNIRTAKAFTLAPTMMAKYAKFTQQARVFGMKKNLLYALMFSGEYFIVFAGMGLAFWQGVSMLARGEVDGVGTIFTVLFSVIVAAATLNSIAPHFVVFSRAATASGELFELMDRESTIDAFDQSGKIPLTTEGHIELHNVSFSYPSRPGVLVLDDFSLSIPAGKVTALVGASGSGKSTIIGLLERWYNPNSGTIKLGGEKIQELNLRWLRTNMRLVQQEPVLFNGTVFENICNGLVGTSWENDSREAKLERVQKAAKIAFAHDFIQELPQGYDTRIGERGGLLSGGQKQRIAIARSVVSEPKVLLLDEATSALDPHAEGIVQRALDEVSKGRTTIVIAHKLKTIQSADNIVVMKRGEIMEQGRHDDLVARGGVYAALVKAQDLSPGKHKESSNGDSEDENEDTELNQAQTLARRQTEMDRLLALQSREDYGQYTPTGVVRTVMKLVAATPEIKKWYALAVLTCVVGAGVYPGQTLLLGRVMGIFNGPDMQKKGNFTALMFFVMALGIAVVYAVLGWSTNIIAQTFGQRIREDFFAAYLRQDLRFFDRPENAIGSLTSKIDSCAQSIFELMGFNIAIITMSLVSVVTCSILSIAFSWKLGLVGVFAGMPPMLLAGYARIRVETKMDADIDKRFANSASIASEAVTAIRTVSSLAIEDDVLRRYTLELDTAIHESTTPLFFMMIWFSLTQAIEYFILGLGFWWGSKLLSEGEITFYKFFISFMSVYFGGQGAGQAFSFASSMTKANSAANYFFWVCSLDPTVKETEENKDKGPSNNCTSYDLQNLEFSYPLAPRTRVLKGVSMKIQPGQFVAFVGASGCGKSTMISLLERFYDPTNGAITIDNTDTLTTLNPNLYRGHVSLVQQEPSLFPGSVRDNIAMGIDQSAATDMNIEEKIIEACRAANAWEFISSLPEGLGTPCGTSGSQLSGGQKQRIAIARSLVRNPSVILLDEATSALDTQSEKLVQAALSEAAASGNKIMIAVAHRLSTVRDADCIFVFSGGRVAEAGTHSELIAQGGLYQKLCEAQSLDNDA